MAAEYTSSREQFGKPLSTFQGVALQAADAYIDTEAMRATLWQAAWRLDEGLDADGGRRGRQVVGVARAATTSCTSPSTCTAAWAPTSTTRVHRYFLWGKQIERHARRAPAHTSPASAPSSRSDAGPTMTDLASDPDAFDDVPVGDELPAARHPADPHADRVDRDRHRATTRTCTTTRRSPSSGARPDIFMNILTTNGFVGRFVTDWAGPDAVADQASRSASARRTTPATRMTMTGTVDGRRTTTTPHRHGRRASGANSRSATT